MENSTRQQLSYESATTSQTASLTARRIAIASVCFGIPSVLIGLLLLLLYYYQTSTYSRAGSQAGGGGPGGLLLMALAVQFALGGVSFVQALTALVGRASSGSTRIVAAWGLVLALMSGCSFLLLLKS